MTHPQCSMYSAMRTDAREFRLPDRTLDLERIEKQARYDTVVLELASMHANPDVVAALRAANPGIRLVAYVVMKVNPTWGGAFFNEMYREVASANGLLFNVDGTYWRDSNCNLARPEVVDAVARVIAKYLTGGDASAKGAVPIRSRRHSALAGDASAQTRIQYDGLFLDVFCARMDNATQSGVDWRRAGFETEKAFQDAWMLGHAALVEKIRAGVGYRADGGPERTDHASQEATASLVQTPFPIVGNCGPGSHADVNGWMRENWPEDRGWYGNMVEYVTPAFTVPGVLHETYREPRMSWLVTRDGATEAERQRRGRFALGSACLRDGVHFSFERREWDAAWCRDGRYIWLKEYEHPQRGKGWLGAATDSAALHTSTMANPPGSGLWVRRFERGIVAVNPTDRAISYRGSETLRPIGKAAKKQWSIPPGDALIAEFV